METKQLIILDIPYKYRTIKIRFEHFIDDRGAYFTCTESENHLERYNRDYENRASWEAALNRYKKKAISIDVKR